MRSTKLALGKRAEAIAADHLATAGFRIVCRNWRNPNGEIDIVAARDATLIFVEVRSRTGTEHGHPLESIGRQKRAQMIRAARNFLEAENPIAQSYRFDVVSVTFADKNSTPPVEILHVENAIQTDL